MNHIRVDFWLSSESGETEEELKESVQAICENQLGAYDIKVEVIGQSPPLE